ncbi:MAG TPA: phosphoribosyltransferase family protein [Chthoniobacterales bacterium]|nr:phosphoribosyltransferase family protein [Chthoniobacterales bacterium]
MELAKRIIPDHPIVLALPRGGVPVGSQVAKQLKCPLDIVVARKLSVPWQPELAIGAIAGQARVFDRDAIRAFRISSERLERVLAQEIREMGRREDLYRGEGAPPPDVLDCTAILVDDGLATGWTMLAAARYVRTLHPRRIIAAVPVGSASGCKRLAQELDDCICLTRPEPFFAVQQWYTDYRQVTDEEVRQILTDIRQIRPIIGC